MEELEKVPMSLSNNKLPAAQLVFLQVFPVVPPLAMILGNTEKHHRQQRRCKIPIIESRNNSSVVSAQNIETLKSHSFSSQGFPKCRLLLKDDEESQKVSPADLGTM